MFINPIVMGFGAVFGGIKTLNKIFTPTCLSAVLVLSTVSLVNNIAYAEDAFISASILPDARSVQVGQTASAFATISNGSDTETAVGCSISTVTNVPGDFIFQATDSVTNQLIGAANAPMDIPPNGEQSFFFAFDPMNSGMESTDVELMFDCDNTDPAPVYSRLNTLLLTSDAAEVPDIIALTSTFVDVQGVVNQDDIFGVASTNIGLGGDITVSLDAGGLPLVLGICQTDATGACLGSEDTLDSSITFDYPSNTMASFAVFFTPTSLIPFDTVNNRIFIVFTDSNGVTRGLTSVSVASDSLSVPANN